jgi:hypothetical protein
MAQARIVSLVPDFVEQLVDFEGYQSYWEINFHYCTGEMDAGRAYSLSSTPVTAPLNQWQTILRPSRCERKAVCPASVHFTAPRALLILVLVAHILTRCMYNSRLY